MEQAGYGYVLEVGWEVSDFRVHRHPADTIRVDHAVADVPAWGWEHRSQGPGAKGLRTHAWAWIGVDTSDPAGCPGGWARSLLIRRDPDPDPGDAAYAYFLCYHRQGTTLSELIGVAGRRWGIEECFAIAKSEAGGRARRAPGPPLDRLVPPRVLVHARRGVPRRHPRPRPGKPHRLAGGLIPHTCNEIRRLLATTVLRVDRGLRFALRWSRWRRRHQARAELSHYRRRGELLHHPSHRKVSSHLKIN